MTLYNSSAKSDLQRSSEVCSRSWLALQAVFLAQQHPVAPEAKKTTDYFQSGYINLNAPGKHCIVAHTCGFANKFLVPAEPWQPLFTSH